jgi:molybdopterin molybdotransferase
VSIVSGMAGLLTIAEALELVLEHVQPLEAEKLALGAAAGRVLAEPAAAGVDLPSFPASAMDGFALRSADVPATLPVVARIAAGRPSERVLEQGEAMAIATGGVVPDGADAVVPIEDVEERGGTVVVPGAVREGANVRPRGGDLVTGDPVVAAGVRLGPVQLGALAAAGVTSVRCHRRPRVVLAVTGSELRSAGEPLARGEIYDANGVILATQIRSTGAAVERLPPVADDAAATRAAIERGLEADVLVTSGGVSVGVHDLVRSTEAELGVEEVFWRVAVRPGKPIAFGVRGRTLVFGLPGNPVSSLVGFELFVRPALLALQGLAKPRPVFRPGRLGRAVTMVDRDSLLRSRTAVENGSVVVSPLSGQESHMIAKAATADALVLIPCGEGELEAGTAVSYLSL